MRGPPPQLALVCSAAAVSTRMPHTRVLCTSSRQAGALTWGSSRSARLSAGSRSAGLQAVWGAAGGSGEAA